MKFTLSWLKLFLDTEETIETIAAALTDIGLEVEEIVDRRKELASFTVAYIKDVSPHPSADKLQICSVQTADAILQIVCGAANARAGIKVVLANIGAEIPNGNFKIKPAEIRGVKSQGMLCSAGELMIGGGDSSGIIELPDNAKIGEEFTKYYGLDDPVIHINVTPNRSDALGVYGIARDLAAKNIGKLKPLEIPQISNHFCSEFNVEVEDSVCCPVFAARIIRNIRNKTSPDWLKRLLENIGIKSISAIVDITNYITYSFGQPMHAYDASKLSSLHVKTLSKAQQFQALNNKEYKCLPNDLVVTDINDVIHSLAGIIGGSFSACGENTENIILESAYFEPLSITKTGRRLQIDTDSRYRFERNIDKNFVLPALDIATQMILSICGGEVSQLLTKSDNFSNADKIIEFQPSFLKDYTGLSLDKPTIISILTKLGFTVTSDNEFLKINVPSWRHDVESKQDIVEEIIRIYGYNKISEIPLPKSNSENFSVLPKEQKKLYETRRIVASLGYDEIITWSFMHSFKAALFSETKNELKLQNPISQELDYMRPSIIPNLLGAIAKNQARSFKNMALFEIGPVFSGVETEDEKIFICGVRCGKNVQKNCHDTSRKIDIFDIKSDLAAILEHLESPIDRYQISKTELLYYHPTRSGSISLGKNIVGHFGQIHPSILKEFGIDGDVVCFELDTSEIKPPKAKFGKRSEFKPSDFQITNRDYAFIMDGSQPVGKVIAYIKNIDKKLIKDVNLFDIYIGDKIENGKKSVAFTVEIQADDHTLTEEELSKLHNNIILALEKNFGAKIRDVFNESGKIHKN